MNDKMLTVEDANSILEHFGKAVLDYYSLDTRLLSGGDLFAYDFITIVQGDDLLSFTIDNRLWTGGYYINDCNISNYTVTSDGNTLIVSGQGLSYVVLTLELSSDFLFDGTTFELEYNPVHFPFIKPFYEEKDFTVGLVDKENNPVSNVDVRDKINDTVVTTDSEGLINLTAGVAGNGLLDYLIETTDTNQLEYRLPYMNIKADLPVVLVNPLLFKNKKQLISFQFLFDDDYSISEDMLFSDNNIVLTVNNVDYGIDSFHDNVFAFFVDLESVDTETVSMVLNISGNDYLNSDKLVFVERLSYFTTDSQEVLESELADSDGADVLIYTGETLTGMVNVDRECEIRFTESVTGGGLQINCDAVLVSPTFDNVHVIVGEDADLTVDGGSFIHTTGSVIKNNGNGTVSVKDCSFVDNHTCIMSKGDVVLSDCVFELGDVDYLDTGTVAFVECLNNLNVNYCNFNINLSVESIGFGYLFFKIGKAGMVNSISNVNLFANEVFPCLKNTSLVSVETERFNVFSKSNKCIVWTVENTNTVYSNELKVDYV